MTSKVKNSRTALGGKQNPSRLSIMNELNRSGLPQFVHWDGSSSWDYESRNGGSNTELLFLFCSFSSASVQCRHQGHLAPILSSHSPS